MLGEDQQSCQSNCAAPAELYVYRNPGQEIEQAVSLNGSAYMDLPVALRYRKEYVNGCSCKQAEYNPTEIEAANKRAEADATAKPVKGKATAKAPDAASRGSGRSACRRDRRPAQPRSRRDRQQPAGARRFTCGRARRAEAARARDGRGTASGRASRFSLGGATAAAGAIDRHQEGDQASGRPTPAIISA